MHFIFKIFTLFLHKFYKIIDIVMKTLIIALVFTFPFMCNAQTQGCTDPLAINYNSSATDNDGTCAYANSSISAAVSFELPDIMMETSGLIFWNNKLWTHNDNSDVNLYSFSFSASSMFETWELTGTSNVDQEEISQDSNYIYLGDFGNNVSGNRTNLRILRIDKQSLLGNTPIVDTIWFSYSDQTDFFPTEANETDFDCEAFIVSTDSIYLFTKQWVSEKTKLYSLSKYPGEHIAYYKSEMDVSGLVTGAYYNRAKQLVVLCGYSSLVQPYFYLLYDFSGNNFFSGNKRKISFSQALHQVEGITSDNNLTFYVSNEKLVKIITIKQKIHQLDLSSYLSGYLSSLTTDEVAPVISSIHNDTVLYVNESCEFVMPDLKNMMSANDDITLPENIIYTQYPHPGYILGKGIYQAHLRAYDEQDNFQEIIFEIAVADTISPIISNVTTTISIEAQADCQASMPDFSQIFSISDNCTSSEMLEVTQTPLAGVLLTGIGNICSYTVIDESGNSAVFEFTINVTDTTSPIIACPEPDSTTLAFGELTYIVNGNEFDIISLVDNCDGPILITNDYNHLPSLAGTEFYPGTIDVTWSVTDFYGNESECVFTSVVSLTSVEDEIWKNIQIFPNPVDDLLNIISSQIQIQNVCITDLNGRIVSSKTILSNDKITCDVSELATGMYIVSICTINKTVKYKLIKN